MSFSVWHHRPVWLSGILDNGWCLLVLWSLTLPKASHKHKGMSCCAVHKAGCRSVRLSLKLLASWTSPSQQLPPKLETISHLSACLKCGMARRTPGGACTDPKSPRLFPGLVWGTGLCAWACAVLFLLMLCILSLGIVFVPQTTALNWLSLEWEKEDLPSGAAEFQWRRHFILAVCRKISLFMSRSLFILSWLSWALRVQLSVQESVAAQLAARCAPLLSPSQMLGTASKVFLLIPGWGFSALVPSGRCPLGLSEVGFCAQRATAGMLLFLLGFWENSA